MKQLEANIPLVINVKTFLPDIDVGILWINKIEQSIAKLHTPKISGSIQSYYTYFYSDMFYSSIMFN